jgi:transcriptional regulator with XRE-family HTH domain
MDKNKLEYRIRKFREAKDLNQAQMAAKLKITASAYSKIERGVTDPSVGRLEQIAAILKIHIKDFFTDRQPSRRTDSFHLNNSMPR